MNDIFKSILKEELMLFMEFIKLSIIDWKGYQGTLLSFDSFLHTECLIEKKIDAQLISRWLDGLNVQLSTKKGRLSQIKKFSDYLSTLGIIANLPELPRNTREFKPYVYSIDEITQIFEVADDLLFTKPHVKIMAEFPVLLRILYGCGLRLGEAASLKWDDIDLSAGVITVKKAKNKKQRIVPMGDELARILILYKKSPCFDAQVCNFLFSNDNGQCRSEAAYWSVFNRILCDLGIKNSQSVKHSPRGPCIHSLRHTFTFHSLLKAEAEGRGFMETVPFLSTYLGHESLMHTDKYLKARHELYTKSHEVISDYTHDVFPQDV